MNGGVYVDSFSSTDKSYCVDFYYLEVEEIERICLINQ
jgi:hypothetical protein